MSQSSLQTLSRSARTSLQRAAQYFPPALLWGMAVYILLAFVVPGLGNSAIALLIPEDHYFEYIGALGLFVSSVLFFYCFAHSIRAENRQRVTWVKSLVYLAIALLFFIGVGEEISWGQRLLGLPTPPSLLDVNAQEELNIHNLEFFSRNGIFSVERFFDIFWFFLAVAIPAAVLLFPRLRERVRNIMPLLPLTLGALFLANYLLAKLAKMLFAASYTYSGITLQQTVQEIKESNYSILFALAGLYAFWELKKSIDAHSNAGVADPDA